MERLRTLTYQVTGRIARITLDRPHRGNGITLEMPVEIARCVERANLDPAVHVIALAGNGKGFCGGYDLVASAEGAMSGVSEEAPPGSPLDAGVIAANHQPDAVWDPVIDYQMMSRNVRGFMSLFHSDKPVVCKVHGFCVAGGTDMALCSDLIVIEETAKIGYPPARVWGVPTTAHWAQRIGPARAKRLLFTGDCLSGREAVEWGLATEAAPAGRGERLNRTLQDRLVNELRVAGIRTVEAANRYIREHFIPDYNARFTRPPRDPESAFVPVAGVDLDQVLCHEEERVVGQDNVVQFEGAKLQIGRQAGRRSCAGMRVIARRHIDGSYSVWRSSELLGRFDVKGRAVELPLKKAA